MIEFRPLTETEKTVAEQPFDTTLVIDDPKKFELLRRAATARAVAYTAEEGGTALQFDQFLMSTEENVSRVMMHRGRGDLYPTLLDDYQRWAYVHDVSANNWDDLEADRIQASAMALELTQALWVHDVTRRTDFDGYTELVSLAAATEWSTEDQAILAAVGIAASNSTIPQPRAPQDHWSYFKYCARAVISFLG